MAQPSARLSEEICLSEGSAGGVSQRALRGRGILRGLCGAAGFSEVFRAVGFVVPGRSRPTPVENKVLSKGLLSVPGLREGGLRPKVWSQDL